MITFDLTGLSARDAGRANAALDKRYRFDDGGTRTLREHLLASERLDKSESDGMIDYNRCHFNRLGNGEQEVYMARLRAKRYYWINGTSVPKIVFDVTRL